MTCNKTIILFCILFFNADESMKMLFSEGNGPVLKTCLSWLSSGDQHLEISGCLALGNFGRSGKKQTYTTVIIQGMSS